MDLQQGKDILNQCQRHELRDHAFGDMEVDWTKDGKVVAMGYVGPGHAEIDMIGTTTFKDNDARYLLSCGTLAHVERNDITGPDDFVAGRIMPGLTKDYVKCELTRRNVFES